LLAGLLLAETEYRRQIEVLIEPFKGLLLGVFLISMGMTIELSMIQKAPLLIFGGAFGLIALKSAIAAALAGAFKVSRSAAVQAGLILSGGGEFSFVVLAAAGAQGLVSGDTADAAIIIATLTMSATPLLSLAGKRLGPRIEKKKAPDAEAFAPVALDAAPRVIIVGYGRVGQVVAEMLRVHQIDFIAVDSSIDVVVAARAAGAQIYFGDATNPLFLERAGLAQARALVVTMDSAAGAEEIVMTARAQRADLTIVSRARDARHAARLYAKGATDAVPETIEASLLLSEALLVDIGVPMGPVIASIHDRRAQFRAEMQQLAPEAEVRPMRRRTNVREGPKK
ncbi:MAG: NAD-binding protein, partial [Hyphomonadaceae bacterium]